MFSCCHFCSAYSFLCWGWLRYRRLSYLITCCWLDIYWASNSLSCRSQIHPGPPDRCLDSWDYGSLKNLGRCCSFECRLVFRGNFIGFLSSSIRGGGNLYERKVVKIIFFGIPPEEVRQFADSCQEVDITIAGFSKRLRSFLNHPQ